MKPKRIVLVSYGIWFLSVVAYYLFIRFGNVRTNLVEGYPLLVNPGSISLALGLGFVFLVVHYLSAIGQATSSDFSWFVAMLTISLFLSVLNWADGAWVIRAFVFLLVLLAFEFHWPNWIWDLRRRLRRKSV